MAFGVSVSGITREEVQETIQEILEDSDGVQIGTDSAGIEVHTSSGSTREGVSVDDQFWIEIYGQSIHFSNTQQ